MATMTRKKLLTVLCMVLLPILAASGTPRPDAYKVTSVPNTYAQDRRHHVSDPDGVLRAETVAEINQALTDLEDSTGIQSMVVMLQSIGEEDVFEFSHNLFRHWGLGSKEKSDGLLILYVGDQRKIRFTTGNGLEGILPDAICKRIQQRYMIPHLRNGETDLAMKEGVKAVVDILRGERRGSVAEEDDLELWVALLTLVGVSVLFLVPLALIHRQAHTCPRCGQTGALEEITTSTYRDKDGIKYIRHTLRCSSCGHTFTKENPVDDDTDAMSRGMVMGSLMGGYGRGHYRSGGFSGGFFGGGSTGGGGATSGW